MGHFNVLKGAYPALIQLDETLPVAVTEDGIVRGSVLVADAGKWRRCAAADAGDATTPAPVAYFALQDQNDPDVTMSGSVNALTCQMPMEVETDQFEGTPAVGDYLTYGDDGVVAAHANGNTAIGIVSKAPTSRWSNAAKRNGNYPDAGTGSKIDVIAFWTCYIPSLATA